MAESYPLGELIQFWRYSPPSAQSPRENRLSLRGSSPATRRAPRVRKASDRTEPDRQTPPQRIHHAPARHLIQLNGQQSLPVASTVLEVDGRPGDIIDSDPFDKMSPPKIGEAVVPVVELDHLRKLRATCRGTDFESQGLHDVLDAPRHRVTAFRARRDEGGPYRHEIRSGCGQGQGDRDRALPLSPKMLEHPGRYLRARGRHKAAESELLWLGKRGEALVLGDRTSVDTPGRRTRYSSHHPAPVPPHLRSPVPRFRRQRRRPDAPRRLEVPPDG